MPREQISIVLDKNKIYSSYYARACKILPNRRLVAISLGIPEGFDGEIMRELNPSPNLLSKYKSGTITEDEYTKIYYTETLSKLTAKQISEKLAGKCILCYCGKDKFCHRKLVIDWLINELGTDIYGGEI